MLIILETGKENEAQKIFEKWDLDFVIIGKTIKEKNLILKYNKTEVGKIPINALSDQAPIYERDWKKNKISQKKLRLKT